ncbi:sigma factor-like helix-turn-helix DNA-binding protein [Caproicibacterium sp. BJN0003]|uniref:sigma factor-like helix-turn-helix DNA-binding protein n=1 Tax=Caproicibacterium sp. BJN0003 TaxID=2994078 RepID=UPI00225592DD|nr:sigma factor-like helix-turn-helix DNA-binding protein [Caproicibacterium sp. BJN0003]UZT82117.1 hypothetical protein OP489_11725 [Caproicibacterium sp. BJN0003]
MSIGHELEFVKQSISRSKNKSNAALLVQCKQSLLDQETLRNGKQINLRKAKLLSYDAMLENGYSPQMLMPWDDIKSDNSHLRDELYKAAMKIIKNELTESQRTIVLKRISGERVKDIALEIGITPTTVSDQYKKGLERIKKFLKYVEPYIKRMEEN